MSRKFELSDAQYDHLVKLDRDMTSGFDDEELDRLITLFIDFAEEGPGALKAFLSQDPGAECILLAQVLAKLIIEWKRRKE